MMNFQQFVGSITSESVRKQQYRKRTKEGQEWDNVPSERQSSDEHMTEGGQTCPNDVPVESPDCDTKVPPDRQVIDETVSYKGQEIDNEVTTDGQEKPFLPLLFGHLPRDGEPPENPIQPTKLEKPKIRKPKKIPNEVVGDDQSNNPSTKKS